MVAVAKVPGQENGADLMTKHKGRPDLIAHLKRLGFEFLSGRPEAAPKRTQGWEIGQTIPVPHSTSITTNIANIDTYVSDSSMHYPVYTYFLEGRNLYPSRPLPPSSRRLLHSLYDLNKGEWLFDGRVGGDDEPNLKDLISSDDTRPWLMASWVVV